MNYKKAWEDLKSDVTLILEEGKSHGYDKETDPNHGSYYAYKHILDRMENVEKDIAFDKR